MVRGVQRSQSSSEDANAQVEGYSHLQGFKALNYDYPNKRNAIIHPYQPWRHAFKLFWKQEECKRYTKYV